PVPQLNPPRGASAAFGMMPRERRRYYRHPLDFTVTAIFGNDERLEAKATNISEGGMAVSFSEPLPASGLSKVSFVLPEMPAALEFRADLAWADESGQAGLRFVDLPRKAQEAIEDWLTRQVATKGNPMSVKTQ